MDNTVIKAENISKRYILGSADPYKTLRESIVNLFRKPLNREKNSAELWALRDVSFEVKQGDIVGIIGRNGAGKSTLLKILARITEPMTGKITMEGRVGSLLEVGTGFHPELSGHENVYLYGAILGMDRYEITRKFDEIIAFAELDKFVETPVKRYSSGMYMRLAFAVAAHLDPEILLIDEVLAVGDAGFQKKCLGKMNEVSKSGRTVIFVSHNMQAVKTLCTRCIYLEKGTIKAIGTTDEVIASYISEIAPAAGTSSQVWNARSGAPGNDKIKVRKIVIVPEGVGPHEEITSETSVKIEIDFWNLVQGQHIVVNVCLYGIDDSPAFESLSVDEHDWRTMPQPAGLFRVSCIVPSRLLNQGTFKVRIIFIDHETRKLFDFTDAAYFLVQESKEWKIPWYGKFIGQVHPSLAWDMRRLEDTVEQHSS